MKKLMIAAIVTLSATAVQAGGIYVEGNLLQSKVKTDLGALNKYLNSYGFFNASTQNGYLNIKETFSDNATGQRFAIGYAFNNGLRFAIDFSNLGKFSSNVASGHINEAGMKEIMDNSKIAEFSDIIDTGLLSNTSQMDLNLDAKVKMYSVGLSTFYDFKGNSHFVPYIGARLSYNHADVDLKVKANLSQKNNVPAISESQIIDSDSDKSFGIGAIAGFKYHINDHFYLNAAVEYHHIFKMFDDSLQQFNGSLGVGYQF